MRSAPLCGVLRRQTEELSRESVELLAVLFPDRLQAIVVDHADLSLRPFLPAHGADPTLDVIAERTRQDAAGTFAGRAAARAGDHGHAVMVRAMQSGSGVSSEHMTSTTTRDRRRDAAERAARKIDQLNAARVDDFQDLAMGELRLAYDSFRPEPHERQPGIEPDPTPFEGDLPAAGADARLDALRELARELDASQETIADRCERVLAVAREGV